jgi:hypothetical protein
VEKGTAYYVKTVSLSILLFFESFFLIATINGFIKSQKYFSPPIEVLLTILVLIYLLIVTNALLAGCWGKWEQYVFPTVPIILGIIMVTYTINSAYAIVVATITFLILAYEMFLASQLKRQLIVFNPRWILRFASKGIVLSFSIATAVLVVVSAGKEPDINVGGFVGDFVDQYLSSMINQEVNRQVESELTPEQITRLRALGLDPAEFTYTSETDIFEKIPQLQTPQLSLKDTVTQEVNKLVEPYKRFIHPIIAILMFGLLQFVGTLAFILYSLTVEIIFWAAKKTGFLKIEKVPTEQEVLHF